MRVTVLVVHTAGNDAKVCGDLLQKGLAGGAAAAMVGNLEEGDMEPAGGVKPPAVGDDLCLVREEVLEHVGLPIALQVPSEEGAEVPVVQQEGRAVLVGIPAGIAGLRV